MPPCCGLLLAVLHTVFSRVDENGTPAPFEETDDALIRWEELYRLGHFPEAPIRAYLEQWRDRFWLFHPERPFWQVPEAEDRHGVHRFQAERGAF